MTEMTITPVEAQDLVENLHQFTTAEQEQILTMLEELEARKKAAQRRASLLDFAKAIEPEYKVGLHHKKLAELLEDMAFGRKDRVTVSIAPRMGKSLLTSTLFPAWFIGNFPNKKIMLVSHTADLAVDFGRKVRNIVSTDVYRSVFPDVKLSTDSKSAGRWSTNKGGEFFAVGIGGAISGRGADFLCIDDPHNEQEILNGNLDIFSKAYEWYAYGARTRLMPGGRVAVIATRWAETDLIGQLHRDMVRNPAADQWEVVEFPALFPVENAPEDAPDTAKFKSLWPEQWPVETLLKTKASMPPFQWAAQYMQQPTSREAAIIKREWWQKWEKDDPPKCEFLIMTLDAAAEKNNRADYTGITVWGVFTFEDVDGLARAGIILLNAIKRRMEFPELKQVALHEYNEWKPDYFVVEKKSSGTPLYQELRRIGILVSEFTPHRGTGDKFVRLNSVSDIFSSGHVWYPAGRRWAEEVVDEVCGFPNMANDDLLDCLVGGTKILMADGTTKNIEDVQEGDFVHTPAGAKPVTAAVCTGEFPVWRLVTPRGVLEGTANHPIATTTGWKSLDSITLSDTIKVSKEGGILWRFLQKMKSLLSQLYLKGTSTTGIRMLRKWHIADILCVGVVENYCTGLFGSRTMAPSPPGTTYTTRTITGTTTTSLTSSACPPLSTIKNTSNIPVSFTEHQSDLNDSTRSARWPQSGTAAKKGWSGTESTQKTPYLKCTRGCANSKKTSVKTLRQKIVWSAARSLRRLALARLYVQTRAPVADIKESGETKKVYNLSVADAHCFYANGVLSHNCTIMALMRFRDGGFIQLPSDWEDDEYFEPIKAAYY